MVTTQASVPVMADILAGHEPQLRTLLESAGQDPANNSLVSFGKLPNVHFARFFILDAAREVLTVRIATRTLAHASSSRCQSWRPPVFSNSTG